MATPDLQQRIQSTLDELRPYLEADGGDIRLVEITEDLVVRIELVGGMCRLLHDQHDPERRGGVRAQKGGTRSDGHRGHQLDVRRAFAALEKSYYFNRRI